MYYSNNTDNAQSQVTPQLQVSPKAAEPAQVSHFQQVNFSSRTVPLNVVDLEKSASNTTRRIGDINETSRRIRLLLANSSYYKLPNSNSSSTKTSADTTTTTATSATSEATSSTRARARSESTTIAVAKEHTERSKFDINYDLDGYCNIRMAAL